MVCVFSYWSETYPRRQVTASCFFCGSSFFFFFFLKMIFLHGKLPSTFMVIEEAILLAYLDKSVLFYWFYNIFTALTTLSPLV